MRLLIVAAAAALALSGCATVGKIDTAIQKNIASICLGAQTGHDLFAAAATSELVPQKYVDAEAAAFERVRALCAKPEAVNTVTLTAAVAAHIAAMKRAKT